VSELDVQPTPALYDHAVKVYEAMKAASTTQELDGEKVLVYEGHLTRLFRDLEIANPYYSRIMRVLQAQNCVVKLRRGGGVAMSPMSIHGEPREETFRTMMERKAPRTGQLAAVQQQQRDMREVTRNLSDGVESLEQQVEELTQQFQDLASRLAMIEGKNN